MDFNVSDTSLAFSDVVGPSHVSGLESFSDFDIGSEYSESFVDQEAHDSGVEEESVTPKTLEPSQNQNKDARDESFSFGIDRLPSGDIKEFLNALESAKAQLGMAISSQELDSPVHDESSLGILSLDSTQETSAFGSNRYSTEIVSSQVDSKPIGKDGKPDDIHEEQLPYSGEYNSPLTLSHLQDDEIIEPEKLPKTTLEQSTNNITEVNNREIESAASSLPSLRLSQSQDELQFMLQTTRTSSGDGGELIDRMSLTSSINFLQSQTFPESLFSLSSYSRGSGSGTDSGPSDNNRDDQDDNDNSDDHTLDLIHDTGDGSNGQSSISVGRPGLEGANSDTEDSYIPSGPPSDIAGSVAGSIELRQSGEGGDVLPDIPGDGGGGGDGSSGHDSDDDQPIGSSGHASSTRSSSRSSLSSCSDQYFPVATPHVQNSSSGGGLDISQGRGPPVGHASTDGSPPLIPSPQHHSGNFSNTSLDQFDVLAASTPMIRPGKNAFQFETGTPGNVELSAIGSQYLFATHGNTHRPGVRVTENSFAQLQDGSFHLSQLLELSRNRDDHDHTLTDAPSLNFEAQGLTPRPQLTLKHMSDYDQDQTLTKTPSKNLSSGAHEGASGTENSLLWKSTPREEDDTICSTPGIVFEGNDRPSPVFEDQGSFQITVGNSVELLQDSRQKLELSSQGRIMQDDTLKRLQTPGGSGEQTIPFSNWSQNSRDVQSMGRLYNNPFEDEGSFQQSGNWNENQNVDFATEGDAEDILAADEKSFEKEHEFDAPINMSPADVANKHDWTIASTGSSATRRSQSKVIGINDPNNEGEVRISFGAFIAAGSEELGTLSGSDPSRPRPQFGEGLITTPSPKAPLRLITQDLSEKVDFEQSTDDYSLYQTTPFKQTNISEVKEHQSNTVKKAPKSLTGSQTSAGLTRQRVENTTEKSLLDEQYQQLRQESGKERRGSQGSAHSSHSSGSRSSVQSVIKKKSEKSTRQRKTSSEAVRDSKQKRHQQRPHREPDGCSSKENAGPQPRVVQSSTLPSALKDKMNVVDSDNVKSAGKKASSNQQERKASYRNMSDGQDSDNSTQQRLLSGKQQYVQPNQKEQTLSSSDESRHTNSTLSSLLTSRSFNSLNQLELAEFIAKAINVAPEHIQQLLHAASDAKSKPQSTSSKLPHPTPESSTKIPHPTPDKSVSQGKDQEQSTPPKVLEMSTQSPELEKLPLLKPIASSSPHEVTLPPTAVTTTVSIQGLPTPTNVSNIFDSMISTYSIDGSVFVQDSPDNVSVIENSTMVSPAKYTTPSPPIDPFSNARIEPTFGKTYTIKDKKTLHIADHQKLELDDQPSNKSERKLSNDFQPVNSVSFSSVSSGVTLMESPDKYSVGIHDKSYDSALYPKPYTDTPNRHSWPKTFTDSPYKQPEVSKENYFVPVSSQQATVSIAQVRGDYTRPVTIGVPAQNIQTQVFPGLSPQFPGQAGTFGYPGQGFAPQSAGLVPSGPLSGTFPMQYQPFSHNTQTTSLGTLLGQVPNPMVHGQYPSNMYPPGVYSAPNYLGQGPISVGHHQGVHNYGLLTSHQPLQANTVSTGLAPRLATATQPFPWQQPSVQVGDQGHQFAPTAPPLGLLQMGQPMGTQGRMAIGDVQMPSGPHTKIASTLTPVVIPGEVKLPPVCPVGVATRSILTLHNSSSKWIYCMVKVAYCTVNGAQVTNSVNNPFFVPSKLIINPHTTIPVEVIFKPNLPGLHSAQLHVTSSPAATDGQQAFESLPSLVALEAVAEQPDIEVLSEDSQVVDFGEMVANSRHSRPLRLINKGKAAIPIRLTITPNATSLHCFSFANADASPKKGSSSSSPSANTTSNKGVLSIHKLVLSGNQAMNGAIEPQVVWILFQAPQKSEPGSGSLGLPDEFTARVDIEMDSEEDAIIGSVLLKSTVGVARLHTPKSLEALTLSGVVGQRISRGFPLRNAGNISLQVDLKVLKDIEFFTVSPSRTVLRPQQEVEVTVQFKPTKADCVIDSTLVMSVLPNGPEYDLLLRGMATSEKTSPAKTESELLLCNKPVVCWGGVAVGNAVQQKVVLKHNGLPSSKRLRLQLSIQHPDFQLQNTFGKVDEKSMASIVNLAPQEELPVHILFAPSTLGLISSSLVIRTNKTKSKVPLHGCGGSSELVLVDTRKLSEGYIVNIGEVYLGKKNVVKLTIKNTGNRAAFVKAVCYSDITSQTVYPASHLSIAPNNFVLPERTSKQVVVVYQPLENDALKCRNEMTTVATIAFYTGDEGIRQQYKRYVQRNDISHTAAQCKGPLTNINFLTAFQDEDKIIEDVVYPQVPHWTQFFQSCVSRVLLMLVGSPPTVQDKDRSLDLVPMPGPSENGPLRTTREPQFTDHEPPSINRKLPTLTASEDIDSKRLDAWTVLPEHLVLTAYKTLSEKGTGRLQIINFSERPLSFEFIWPAQYLTITPDSGHIPLRSQVMVVMSPRPTLHSSGLDLPWAGTVYIQCDGTQKAVRVQIREEVVLENSPYQPGAALQVLETKEGAATPFTPALPTSHLAPLIVKNKQIQFQETMSGKESVMELVMENASHSSVMWDLSSVAPAYIKASDDSGDLYRATYTVFSFHKRSGVAASLAGIRIPIHFQPRDPGRYSQFWDLQFKQEGTRRVYKQKIELIGQAIRKSITEQRTATNQQTTKSREPQVFEEATDLQHSQSAGSNALVESATLQKTNQGIATGNSTNKTNVKRIGKTKGMYLAESVVNFPQTTPGQSSVMKVKICNDANEECTVKIVTPKGPFTVTHQDVILKPRHYVRIPIKFTPIHPATNYEAVALFTSGSGSTQQITLIGSSTNKLS